MSEPYTLVTNFLQTPSYPVLVDWLDFLPYPPQALLCYCGENRDTEKMARELCAERGIEFVLPPGDLTEDIRKSDLPVIRWHFENTKTPWCMRVALDTIPYRTDEADWLSQAIDIMKSEDRLFLTGSTKPFRADQPAGADGFLLTTRVSLNFFMIRPERWIEIFDAFVAEQPVYKRFFPEGAIEHYSKNNNVLGLRLENTTTRRVFHVQEWDERVAGIRTAFRAGQGIGPFLDGYTDDERYDWERYFMWPKPPVAKRARIAFGAWRRRVLGT